MSGYEIVKEKNTERLKAILGNVLFCFVFSNNGNSLGNTQSGPYLTHTQKKQDSQ